MSIESFEALLSHHDPCFVCYASGDPSQKEGFVGPLEHVANPPAEPSVLDRIPQVPGASAARDFYSRHDGALLYAQRGGFSEIGVEIFPIGQWPQRTAQMVESWEEGGYEDSKMPYGRDDFVAFAHVDGASSYIHWVINGPSAGAIYWWAWTMPPMDQEPPLAADFASFLDLISTQPIHFLNDLLLCYTRFQDGTRQWIPSRYVADLQGEGL